AGFLALFFVQRYLHFHHHDVPEEAPERRGSEEGWASFDHDAGHEHGEHGGALTLADKSARHLSWMGAAFGLTLHTLLDGVALAASVELDRYQPHAHGLLGFGTFLVIFLHKPFDALAVGTLLALRNSSRSLRHWVNGLFALANPAGLLLFYLCADRFSQVAPHFLGVVLAFAAGTFLSIAASDLLPELNFFGVVAFQERPCLGPRQQLCDGRPVQRLTTYRSGAAFCQRSGSLFRDPIAQFQVFPYFAAFVAVFFRFIWPVIDLSEGVFGVANYVGNYVECLRHGSDPLFIHT